MNWTDKQRKAIEERGKNILVSAAAGSGKTAVLVERIKKLIIEEEVDISQFLVVTFTKAASSEMKDKIVKAIERSVETSPHKEKFLKKQLDSMHNANISTFHSFAMEIVREYFYIIDVNPKIKICDDAESLIMKGKAVDEAFKYYFEEKDEDFQKFLLAYSSHKGDNTVKENLLKLYDKVRSMPDEMSWLGRQVEKLSWDEESFKGSPAILFLREHTEEQLRLALAYFHMAGNILSEHKLSRLNDKNNIDIDKIEAMVDVFDNHDDLRQSLLKFKPEMIKANNEEKKEYVIISPEVKELRDAGKKIILGLRDEFYSDNLMDSVLLVNKTHIYGKILCNLLEKIDQGYRELKNEKVLTDFNDIEHYAIDILKNRDVAARFQEKFQYIFVDEYQDSNLLQEELIGKIARDRNLFLVGDIKQSIYGFRLAEPSIFSDKYSLYSQDGINSMTIDLNENFRSKANIIEGINNIFSPIIDGYNADASLYMGRDPSCDVNYKVEIHGVDMGDHGEADEMVHQLSDMKAAHMEAKEAVAIIRDTLGKPIYDVKKEVERPIELRDIVILFRGAKNMVQIYEEVFNESGIPVYYENNSGYFDAIEIITFVDLLKVIDNGKQDISLLSALRSPVFNFSVDELVKIRMQNKQVPFFQAFREYARIEEGEDLYLREKCVRTMEFLDRWQNRFAVGEIDRLVWDLMEETGYYAYCGILPAGAQRQANLRAFVDKTLAFKKRGNNSIFGLLRYIEAMSAGKVDTGQMSIISEGENIVRMMTIHKSKGLEFPVVIVGGMGKRIRSGDGMSLGSMHKDAGFAMDYVNVEERWRKPTLLSAIIKRMNKKRDMDEEIRILYVAMTRAMDRLYLLSTGTDWYGSMKSRCGIASQSTYMDIIHHPMGMTDMVISIVGKRDLLNEDEKEGKNLEDVLKQVEEYNSIDDERREKFDRILSYSYQGDGESTTKSKYTVTELNRTGKVVGSLKAPSFLDEERTMTGADRGTILHKVMEHLDFAACSMELVKSRQSLGQYIEGILDELVERQILIERERSVVDVDPFMQFFESQLGRRASARVVEKERPFNIKMESLGHLVLVQGVIDCYFEEDDGIVLIDFKSNWTSSGAEENYREQIALYKKALEMVTGKRVKESYLFMLNQGKTILMDV